MEARRAAAKHKLKRSDSRTHCRRATATNTAGSDLATAAVQRLSQQHRKATDAKERHEKVNHLPSPEVVRALTEEDSLDYAEHCRGAEGSDTDVAETRSSDDEHMPLLRSTPHPK